MISQRRANAAWRSRASASLPVIRGATSDLVRGGRSPRLPRLSKNDPEDLRWKLLKYNAAGEKTHAAFDLRDDAMKSEPRGTIQDLVRNVYGLEQWLTDARKQFGDSDRL